MDFAFVIPKYSVKLSLVLLLCFPALFYCEKTKIQILGLFDTSQKEQEYAFSSAVNELNEDTDHPYLYEFSPVIRQLSRYDSFNISKTICTTQTDEGRKYGAIFGPDFDEITGIVQSISEKLNVPHIDTRWDTLNRHPSKFFINLYPDSALYARAIYEVLDDMDWKTFTLIYESKDSLVYVQEVLKAKMHPSAYDRLAITLKELPDSVENYSTFLKDIKTSLETRIMLHCSPEKVIDVLRESKNVKLLGQYYNFFIISLDAHTIDYGEFMHERANITTLRLISPENEIVIEFVDKSERETEHRQLNFNTSCIKTDTALMRDAVYLFAETIRRIKKNIVTKDIICAENPDPWEFGAKIIHQMRQETMDGMSGWMKFNNTTGSRIYFKLDIVQLNQEGFRVLATWDPDHGVRHLRNVTQMEMESQQLIENKTLLAITKTGLPYLEIIKNDSLKNNDRFEGFSKDLLDEIAKEMHFSYILEIGPDNSQGKVNEKTGKWDGLMGELQELRADLAICDFTITHEREKAVDFTVPFMTLGIGILHTKPPPRQANYFSFVDPFNFTVWSYLATGYLGISLAMFLIARCAPYEWVSPHPCEQDSAELENAWNLRNCLWFALGSVLQQGCDILPRAWSARLTAGMWWFFSLIVTTTYTANLAAFLTTQRMESPIKDVNGLANQDKIKYGCYINGSTASFFQTSNVSLYQRMWATMESQNPSVFTTSNKDGLKRVLNSKNKYAFLMESSTIEYEKNQNCELVQVGDLLDSKKYGIALPLNSRYKKALDIAILKLGDGRLAKLKEKWWKNPNGECEDIKDEDKDKLQLSNVGGVFVLLILGCILAFFISILEFLWNVRKVAVREKITLSEAFWLELKFAFRCQMSTKPVRHTPQSGMSGTPLTVSQTGFDKYINRT